MLESLFKEYNEKFTTSSPEKQRELIIEYIYSNNKLSNSPISLEETINLLDNNLTPSKAHIGNVLETLGMEKAIYRVFRAILNKEILSYELILELNWLIIGASFELTNCYGYQKSDGQLKNTLRNNTKENHSKIKEDFEILIRQINNSIESSIEKSSKLAMYISRVNPFLSANQRVIRLLTSFLTYKEGYPLFTFKNSSINYIEDYTEEQFKNSIIDLLKDQIESHINDYNNAAKFDPSYLELLSKMI